jgi:DNA-binding SARP family transcriptional activator
MSGLKIQLLGGFQLTDNESPVTNFNSPRLQEFLTFILLHRHTTQSRQRIAFLFWSDTSDRQARTNLRQLLHNLRSSLPSSDRYLITEEGTIGWNPEASFQLDVAQFEEALEAVQAAQAGADQNVLYEQLKKTISLYTGPLLPDCYDDWLLKERQQLEKSYGWALEKLVQILEERRDYQTAILKAEQLLVIDPLNEKTYRKLMNLHALSGDLANAASVYNQCREILQNELGIPPAPETEKAYQRLLSQPPEPAQLQTLVESPEQFRLIGRHSEWKIMRDRWRMAEGGEAQFVLIRGEAGIGKSRLAEETLNWVGGQGYRFAATRAYATGGRLAYAPVVEWLKAAPVQEGLAKLKRIWLSEISRLLPDLRLEDPLIPEPEPLTNSFQRRLLFEALVRAFCGSPYPLLLVIDDLQWCDQDTLEWMGFLIHEANEGGLMVVGTARSEEIEPDHPLTSLVSDLNKTGQLAVIDLERLDEADTSTLAQQVVGRELSMQALKRIYQDTEGNPLFVVEMVRSDPSLEEQEAGGKGDTQQHTGDKSARRLPPKVQTVIESRLRQLSEEALKLARLAAVIGRDFNFELLLSASTRPADELVESLDELWQHRILRQRGTNSYDFSHDRIRDVAYAQISPPRLRWLHERVAQALEELYASNLEAVSGQLATHYERAGVLDKAISNYYAAGAFAQRIYANREALQMYEKGLELLERIPTSLSRTKQELELQMALGQVYLVTYGYASSQVEGAMRRAQELCMELGEKVQLFHALFGQLWVLMVRGNLRDSYPLAEEIMRLAQGFEQPIYLLAAHYSLGGTYSFMGEFKPAHRNFETAISLYKSRSQHSRNTLLGIDLGVFCQSWITHALWHLGYPDQAIQAINTALVEAQDVSDPFSQAIALAYGAMLHHFLRDREATLEWAKAAVELCTKYDFKYYLCWSAILESWAVAIKEPQEKNIARLRKCLADFEATESGARLPYYYSLLAEVYAETVEVDAALEYARKGLEIAEKNQDHGWTVEIHRMIGELSLSKGVEFSVVEDSYNKAIRKARQQKSKALELRAAISLSRLWREQDRKDQASNLLEGIFSSFSEGFGTKDLIESKQMLDEFVLKERNLH